MKFEHLADGEWFEGIAVDGDTVWYSDVFARGVRRYPAHKPNEVWRGDERWISALQVNADGKILSSGATGIVWFDPNGPESGVLISEVDGKPLPGINEMVVDASGALYFGTVDSSAFERGTAPGPSALYRLTSEGKATRLTDDLKFSNGLALSPDGRRLYHCETFVGVNAYDVRSDGTLGAPELLVEKADCDGLKVDVLGRLWVSGFQSPELLILRPDGREDDRFAVPGAAATNHHFGGSDGRDIYITVVVPVPVTDPSEVKVPVEMKSGLWRGRTPIAGIALHRPQFKLGTSTL